MKTSTATQDADPAAGTDPHQPCTLAITPSLGKSRINGQGEGEALEQGPSFPFQPCAWHTFHFLHNKISGEGPPIPSC